jgi:ABC-2 type transport system permease protein
MRYVRLWRQFLVTAFVREAEYRFNFLVGVGEGFAQLGLAVVTFLLLYRFTDSVAGWSQPEALLLVGIYRIVEGLLALQIAPNMMAVSGMIRRGDMDALLLRPVSSQFLVSLRAFSLADGVNVLAGIGLTVYAGDLAGVRWSIPGIAEAGAFIICGLVLLYAIWFGIVTCSFWLVQLSTIDTLFYSLFETGRYPVSFFRGLVRAVLTFVVPVAFATTFPVEALLGRADLRLLLIGVLLAVFGLVTTHLLWNYAVRHYSSASS